MGIVSTVKGWLGIGGGITARSVPLLPSAREGRHRGELLSAIPMPVRTQWLLTQIAQAQHAADGGNLLMAAQLSEAMRLDGMVSGLLSTRTQGLVILPRAVSGRGPLGERYDDRHPLLARLAEEFDDLCPPGELAALQADHDMLGVGVGELVERPSGLALVRHRPEYISWDWGRRVWRYNGEEITPGNGRWVVHSQVAVTPWNRGAWYACARAFISKDHAYHLRENYSHKLANAARVAEVPESATQLDAQAWFQQVASWQVDPVFAMRPGYKVSLLESTGQGYQVYAETMKQADEDLMIALAGQTVTTKGSSGFGNNSISEAIREDIVQFGANSLAGTLRDQVFPWWQQLYAFDDESRLMTIRASYDTMSPAERKRRAEVAVAISNALSSANTSGIIARIDVDRLLQSGQIPLLPEAQRVITVPAQGVA